MVADVFAKKYEAQGYQRYVAWSEEFIAVYIAVLCCNFLFLSFPSIAKFVDSKLRAGNKVNQNKE